MDEQRDDYTAIRKEMDHYLTDPDSFTYLYRVLRLYVARANFVIPAAIDEETCELLQNLTVKAFEIADKYHGGGIHLWLFSIAHRLLKQRKADLARRRRHELSVSETYRQAHTNLSEEEYFERCMASFIYPEGGKGDIRMQLKEALIHLSEDDQRLIYYYFEYGLNHNEIAQRLHITPGTARVRCHRILHRLRSWIVLYEQKGRDHLA